MSGQLAQQVQEILGTSDLVIITEQIDDVALLIGRMVKMGVVEVLDRQLPRYGKQRGLSWGWTAMSWLAYILTEGDHRKVSGETSGKGLPTTRSPLRGAVIAPLDCRDDRLSHLRKHWSQPKYGHGIERHWKARSLEVYPLPQDVIRGDATTVPGDHGVTARGLWPCGPRQDEPMRPPNNVRTRALDPLGMPLATDVRAGERAADGIDMPRLERIESGRHTTGRLLGGDGHLRVFATRAHQVGHQHVYRSPWPLTGATAEAIADWITAGVGNDRDGKLEQICRAKHRGAEGLAAEGDEFARTGGLEAGLEPGAAAGLDKRLAHAAKQLAALTPASGRGKRQSTGEATRVKAMQHGLTAQGVEGLRCMEWEPPIARPPHDVGRGRGAATRAREHPRPHHPHRPSGERHRRPHRPLELEGVCHQRRATAVVLGGCGLV